MSIADQMGLFDGSQPLPTATNRYQPLPIVAYTDTDTDTDTETDTERSKK